MLVFSMLMPYNRIFEYLAVSSCRVHEIMPTVRLINLMYVCSFSLSLAILHVSLLLY